mmetsp:Transcript_89313/g.193309  ORF Transcript_89313/g.193309 Transcript_89313/m.193309 type:complete len:200 (+) Transcript_89313:371-970(+)
MSPGSAPRSASTTFCASPIRRTSTTLGLATLTVFATSAAFTCFSESRRSSGRPSVRASTAVSAPVALRASCTVLSSRTWTASFAFSRASPTVRRVRPSFNRCSAGALTPRSLSACSAPFMGPWTLLGSSMCGSCSLKSALAWRGKQRTARMAAPHLRIPEKKDGPRRSWPPTAGCAGRKAQAGRSAQGTARSRGRRGPA